MLHILLLILKIIGIILAVILGLIILLLCIVLFTPICYQGSGKCDGKLDSLCGILKISWLFNLIQINAKYENGDLKYSIRIAWKKILGGKSLEKTKDSSKEEKSVEESASEPVKSEEVQKVVKKAEKDVESISEKTEEKSIVFERSEETVEAVEEKLSFKEKIKIKIAGIKEKIDVLLNKIKCTIKNIYDKLKMLLEKKDKIMQFIKDKNHVKAFLKIKKELFKLLKRLKPKMFIVKARFGFEDPSLTGKILAGLSVMYAFTEDHMEIIPDFENQVIDGRVTFKGRIYLFYFLCLAWNLFWCKQIRMLYKDIRNFKL